MVTVSLKNRLVLTLDDDPLVSLIIGQALQMDSVPFVTSASLLSYQTKITPVAIFVDMHLTSNELGIDAIPAIREKFPGTPIIVITANRSEEALAQSLAIGADDFIRKPLSQIEVTARLQKRLAEFAGKEARDTVKVGDVSLNRALRQIRGRGQKKSLSPIAFRILEALVEARGTEVGRDLIKRKAWGGEVVTDNTLDRKIHEIRSALKETSHYLSVQAIYGRGLVLKIAEKGTEREAA